MPRLGFRRPAAPRGAGLLVLACLLLGGTQAVAQTVYPDPLDPKLANDPRNPPRFQKFTRPEQAQMGPPATFTEPPSAAGDTGYDSTNSRKAKAKRAQAKPQPAKLLTGAKAATPATTVSPYQKPPTMPGSNANASAPGEPPVQLGPIRRKPTTRKAHTEPDDPYAALGVRAGSFTLFPAIELIGGYDTNPARSSGGKSAGFYTVAPELQAQSNWSRHELKANLRGRKRSTRYSRSTNIQVALCSSNKRGVPSVD